MASLKGKTLFVTGGSRGIGLAIALRAARDGANVAVIAKTTQPHPKLPGTIFSAAEAIEAAGGHALPCAVDVRDEAQIADAVAQTVSRFGGIDILVNNASAIHIAGTMDTPMKRFDLMHQINTRGTFACAQACIPHLKKAANPHILMLAPPPSLEPRWFGQHLPYTLAKMGMSFCVLGLAEEFRRDHIAVNGLWPRTIIATAAIRNLLGGDDAVRGARKPEIVADAAHEIFVQPSQEYTGNFFIDEDVLRKAGVTGFDDYAVDPTSPLFPDIFLP